MKNDMENTMNSHEKIRSNKKLCFFKYSALGKIAPTPFNCFGFGRINNMLPEALSIIQIVNKT